jgi:ABC-type nitrate/sulfonate/bicarbonate transport system ATPase subunit
MGTSAKEARARLSGRDYPKDPTLLAWKSVLDNIMFPVTISQTPPTQYEERVKALVDQVGRTEFEGIPNLLHKLTVYRLRTRDHFPF